MRDQREVGGAWTTFQDHWKGAPAAALAPYVSHYWAVSWDLRGQPPYRQKIVPYPQVHLSFLDGRALVRGVARGFVVRELEGRGRVFGVAFRPGCFRPFLGRPVSTITDRTLPAAAVFDGAPPAEASKETVDAFLLEHLPGTDPAAGQAADLVERIATTPDLTRVDALAAGAGLGMRALQRLFSEYVGVGPKWVIRRYRLHEITERLAAGGAVGGTIDWAALAADLGYADQAHLTRDFTKLVGEPPTHYAERYPRRPSVR